jgi:predicted nucleic acid-binding protein
LKIIYVDTSARVALIVNEPQSAPVAGWYAASKAELVSAAWCVPEFASALGIKQRTGQLTAQQAHEAWERFRRLAAHDLKLLPVKMKYFTGPRG